VYKVVMQFLWCRTCPKATTQRLAAICSVGLPARDGCTATKAAMAVACLASLHYTRCASKQWRKWKCRRL